MGRENCQMCQVHMGKIYCDYYDAFCRLCVECEVCPEGLDDDEHEDYEGYPDEDELTDYDNEY